MERVDTPLADLLRCAEASYPDRGHKIWEVWVDALGEDLASRCHPLNFSKGRLTVGVSSAAWMQQLTFLREQIRDSLNQALGQVLVQSIRLRADAKVDLQPPDPNAEGGAPPWLSEPLPPDVVAAVDAQVSAVRDPELRKSLRQVRLRSEQVRRFRRRLEGV